MKIKLFIITGVALAFSAVTSLAVSFNIPGSGVWSLITMPWYTGEDSMAILTPNFQGGENLWTWNGHGYYQYTYEGATTGTTLGFQSDWIDAASTPPSPPSIPGDQTDTSDDVYWAPAPVLTACQSFFLQNPYSTYSISVTSPTAHLTPTVTLLGGSAYNFFGNATTLSGKDVTDPLIDLTANFVGGENVYVWTGSTWYIYQFEGAGVGTGLGYPSDWVDVNGNIPSHAWDSADQVYWTQPLTVQVGQGLVIQNPNSSETWTESINW